VSQTEISEELFDAELEREEIQRELIVAQQDGDTEYEALCLENLADIDENIINLTADLNYARY
jgi:hypothetical protein